MDNHLQFDEWKKVDEDPFYDWKLVRKVRNIFPISNIIVDCISGQAFVAKPARQKWCQRLPRRSWDLHTSQLCCSWISQVILTASSISSYWWVSCLQDLQWGTGTTSTSLNWVLRKSQTFLGTKDLIECALTCFSELIIAHGRFSILQRVGEVLGVCQKDSWAIVGRKETLFQKRKY